MEDIQSMRAFLQEKDAEASQEIKKLRDEVQTLGEEKMKLEANLRLAASYLPTQTRLD